MLCLCKKLLCQRDGLPFNKKENSWQEAPNESEPPAISYVPIQSISRETENLLAKLDEELRMAELLHILLQLVLRQTPKGIAVPGSRTEEEGSCNHIIDCSTLIPKSTIKVSA